MVVAGGPGNAVRRWELTGGGAARFWEAELLGGTVRVRAGRTGADSATGWDVHPFGDPAVASTRLAGMVAEQERKGYRPVGAAPPASAAGPLPDEDTLTLPDRWRILVVPRRGGRAQSPADWPDAAAVAVEDALIAGNRTAIQSVCRSERTDPELEQAARAYLHGVADPLGAACVAAMLPPAHLPHHPAGGDLVDAWTARHGLAFAARAAVESFGIDYGAADPDAHRTGLTRPNRFTRHLGEAQTALLRWTRHLLSIAERPAYEEARAAVAELRTDTDRRALAAYLFPAETGWVAAALDEFPARHGNDTQVRQRQVLSALGTAAQVARLGATPPHGYVWTPAVVATLADGVGTACVPLLAAALRVQVDGEAVRELADYLLEFPADEAFAALLERAEDRHVGPVLRQAADRQPVRATRLLAAAARSGRPMARHLLDRHLRTHADRLPAVLARLDAATAEFVASLDAAGPPAPTAPPEALPAVLAAPPARMPHLPDWADPSGLPPLLLPDGSALPEQAVRRVLAMAALTRPGAPHPGLAQVAAAVRPSTRAAFCWALFQDWRLAGMPAKEGWVLPLLGEWGDDTVARGLAPVLREWPGQGAHRRAVEGLDVLAAIGTDTALRQLHALARRVKFKGLRTRAQEKVTEVAEAMGLTPDQLADRLVPDLDLSPDGTIVFDYGTRTFTVGFDEQLHPYVVDDADGRRRKNLPVPGAQDDPELASAARKRFTALKKDARALATEQLARLEAAMVSQRSWTAREFTDLLLSHPLLGHPARRLVWTADGTAFRITEDRTPIDVHDAPFPLRPGGEIRLAHPALLGVDLSTWTARFIAHGLTQPFPQLSYPVRTLTTDETADPDACAASEPLIEPEESTADRAHAAPPPRGDRRS
ncbi:DUF4132 domain-containing protein [Kitasatospora sp. NPDC088134]|uniref:DUF4132 domain-containing protein n=1 Tax=Kitasatospora sp. NPDC088134 TaxID=3364071 RepID=UPI0037FA973D